MATLTRLRIAGWMPFAGDHVLELPPGPIAVVARYESNPRRSNMAGKTSLIEAITWALFGVHRKRRDDDVVNTNAEECVVELSFADVVVRREKKRGSATVLTVTAGGETRRNAAAQDLLLERLAQNLDDYRATSDFQQGDIESLVGMRTSKRREVVSSWLRLDRWSQAGARAADRLRAARTALEAARGASAALDGLTPEAEREAREGLQKAVAKLESLEEERAGLEAALERGWDHAKVASQIQELVRLRNEGVRLKAELQRRDVIELDHNTARDHLVGARAALTTAEARKAGLQAMGRDGFDGQCPVMCAPCPARVEVDATVRRSTELFRQAEKELDTALIGLRYATRHAEAAETEMRAVDTAAGRFAAIRIRAQELIELIGNRNAAAVSREAARQQGHRTRLAELAPLIAETTRIRATLEARLAAHDETLARRLRAEQALIEAEAAVHVAALVLQALGPAGVPARIARRYVEGLERSANELLADSGLVVEFAWERVGKELAPTCIACGFIYAGQRQKVCPSCEADRGPKLSDDLELLVDDGSGEVEDVRMKSGGARVLVASALRLSAVAMLREVRGTPVGWATIDEPFGPLDTENREHLARVLGAMLGTVGLEQAFVVSHDVALLDALPHRILIERLDTGVSTVRMEAVA
jgi:DNA repair exonuclease SbcCD ATPase subunit